MFQQLHSLRKLWRRREGSALIEFAIAAPVLIFIFLGIVEVSRFLLFRDKLQSAATQMLDIINQNNNMQNVTKASLDNLYAVLPDMMKPYTSGVPKIIVTQIIKPTPPAPNDICSPRAAWQYEKGNSKLAPKVGEVAKTGDITMVSGDSVMAIEIFVNYAPFFDTKFSRSFLGGFQEMYTVTYAHGRYGSFNIDPETGALVNVPCK